MSKPASIHRAASRRRTSWSWRGRMGFMVVLLLSSGTLSAGCRRNGGEAKTGSPSCSWVEDGYGPPGKVPLVVETVAGGLVVPWGMAFLPDGALLVNERPGRIRLIRDGELVEQPVATIEVTHRAEDGLLGLALHPGFAGNRLFYVFYTVDRGEDFVSRIARYELAPDATSATLDRIVFDGIPAARYHTGGHIAFGPDGMLYAGTGDANSPQRAQDPASPNGKLLRLTPEGEVPPDNPRKGNPLYLLGIRNLEAWDWLDRTTILLADHGPSGELGGRTGGDEVSVARAGDNLGWPDIWRCASGGGMVTPLLAWKDAVPPGGGTIYRGEAIPEWRGSFLIGTLRSRHLHRVVLEQAGGGYRVAGHEVYLAGDPPEGYGRLRTVLQGPDGLLYVSTSNCDALGTCPPEKDRILRIRK